MTNVLRQGDVILREVLRIPKSAKFAGTTLRETGETGHVHELDKVKVFTVTRQPSRSPTPIETWVEVGQGGALMVHPEHPELAIPPGKYIVQKVRTYTYEAIKEAVD